jgi:hypothetical protein
VEPGRYWGSYPPPPRTIISLASTLPRLQYVTGRGLQVAAYSSASRLDYAFEGFPASVVYAAENIQVSSIYTTSPFFLSNVLCAPKNLIVTNNAVLTSLSGVNIWPQGLLASLTMSENPSLPRAGYQPLLPVLQCDAPSPPHITVSVTPADCYELTSVSLFCTYIQSGCPPPSPPLPP